MLTTDESELPVGIWRMVRQIPKKREIVEAAIWAVLAIAGTTIVWLLRQIATEE